MDSPPGLVVTDAAVLSSQTDGILLVVNVGQTTRNHLKQTVEVLKDLNQRAGLIGVVLNGLSSRRDGYYNNYYYTKDSYYNVDGVGYGMETNVKGNGGFSIKRLLGKH